MFPLASMTPDDGRRGLLSALPVPATAFEVARDSLR